MSTTETALTAHLIVLDMYRNDTLLSGVTAGLAREFDIHHATIQVESASSPLREDGAACRIPAIDPGGETKPPA